MVIGLTGTNGAGKTAVAQALERRGFVLESLSDEIRRELAARDLPPTRDNLTEEGNRLRTAHGPAVLAERVKLRLAPGGDYVIDSIRNPSEVRALEQLPDFRLIHLDASREERYRRVRERGGNRKPQSFEEFVEQEDRELESADPARQQLRACYAMAAATLRNEGSLAELEAAVDKLVGAGKGP